MTVTLITGANKGLGFEAARRLIALGHAVYVGAQTIEQGTDAIVRLATIATDGPTGTLQDATRVIPW